MFEAPPRILVGDGIDRAVREPAILPAHRPTRTGGRRDPIRASAGKRARTAITSNVEAVCRVVITAKRPTGRSLRHGRIRKGHPYRVPLPMSRCCLSLRAVEICRERGLR